MFSLVKQQGKYCLARQIHPWYASVVVSPHASSVVYWRGMWSWGFVYPQTTSWTKQLSRVDKWSICSQTKKPTMWSVELVDRWKVTLSQMTAYLGWWPSICSAGMRIPSRVARKVLIWTALKWLCSDLGCLVDFIAVHMMFPTGSYKQWHCSQWCCFPLLSNWKVQLGKKF